MPEGSILPRNEFSHGGSRRQNTICHTNTVSARKVHMLINSQVFEEINSALNRFCRSSAPASSFSRNARARNRGQLLRLNRARASILPIGVIECLCYSHLLDNEYRVCHAVNEYLGKVRRVEIESVTKMLSAAMNEHALCIFLASESTPSTEAGI